MLDCKQKKIAEYFKKCLTLPLCHIYTKIIIIQFCQKILKLKKCEWGNFLRVTHLLSPSTIIEHTTLFRELIWPFDPVCLQEGRILTPCCIKQPLTPSLWPVVPRETGPWTFGPQLLFSSSSLCWRGVGVYGWDIFMLCMHQEWMFFLCVLLHVCVCVFVPSLKPALHTEQRLTCEEIPMCNISL